MKCSHLPVGNARILTTLCRLEWREILETGRSVREVRVQLRNEEVLNDNTDGRDSEMAFRNIWETNGEELRKFSRFLIGVAE